MDQEQNRYGDSEQLSQKPSDQEVFEFRSEMPRHQTDAVDYIPEEELEDEPADEI